MIPESTFRQYIAAITGNAVRTLPDHRCAYNPWRCEPYDAPEYVPPADCERARAKRGKAWWDVGCDCGRCHWDDCSGFSVLARFRCETTAIFWRDAGTETLIYPCVLDRPCVYAIAFETCHAGKGACS